MRDISEIIENDNELLKLYQNDPIFHNTVEQAKSLNISTEDTLIAAIKIGYSVKDEIYDRFLKYMQVENQSLYKRKI